MINVELLNKAIEDKLVSVQKHPEAELYIYNYTPIVQYGKLWDEITLQTRGLILDANYNYVARPFGKFKNIEEHEPSDIPNEPFDVFDKLDGSLGILYWLNDKPYISTRGSFTSDQAIHATEILYTKYSHLFDKLNKNHTYLFEILYPENRIVVSYGDLDDLVLLTQIDIATGKDVPMDDIGFSVVKRYDGINDISVLKSLQEDNKEGFVIRFKSGFRVKVKFDEYVRLHRIVTGVSNIAIWEYLRDGKSFNELLEKVPDEFNDYVRNTIRSLTSQYQDIEQKAQMAYRTIVNSFSDVFTKKDFALEVFELYPDLSGILFNIHSGKDYSPIIWKMIRPVFSKSFKTETEL